MPDPARIDPELLPTLLAVAEHGGIAAAARAVDLSQPAVSARIHRLERALGTALFERSARGVSPTPAGQRLLHYAREVQELRDRAAREVGPSRSLGPLAIMASTTIAAQVLPTAFAAYRRRHPDVRIDLAIGNTKDVIEAVRGGAYPLGLVEGHRRVPAVRLEPWLDDELQLVIGRDAPAAWRPRRAVDLSLIHI